VRRSPHGSHMKAPFPWFGGKRRVAAQVWNAFGDVDNYVEPFAGSLAVPLERPASHRATCETVNDEDRYIANLWRAISAAPDEVARWADSPINEADLLARHRRLIATGAERIARIDDDPDWYDAKVAGWWVWGLSAWIGSGWCVSAQRQLPHLGGPGQGVHRRLPHLGDPGRGVHQPGDFVAGGSGSPDFPWNQSLCLQGESAIYGYMRAMSARLRRVRVCCGDWSRIVTTGALNYGSTVGVFLDPPYSDDVRHPDLYASDSGTVSAEVSAWCREHGDDRRLRIALCGYEGEHDLPDWHVLSWKATGAYLGQIGNKNRHRERIWFSPGCLVSQGRLFE